MAGAGGTAGASGTAGVDGGDSGPAGSGGGWSWGGGSSGGSGSGYFCDAGGFWPCTYNPKCTPLATAPADHDAYRTTDCRSCHGPSLDVGASDAGVDGATSDAGGASAPDAGASDASASDSGTADATADGGAAPRFLFSGFVWDPYTPKGEPNIEVAVGDGNVFYYTCTDDRGFFFIPASAGPQPNWLIAQSHIRSSIAEKTMPPDKQHGPGCNSAPVCHGDPQNHLFAPL